ncbi:MAG: DinB family protein [Sphingobacteriaceae bacterium]
MKPENDADQMIRRQLSDLIRKGNAHAAFEAAVESLPINLAGKKVSPLPYTIWQLVEHIRIAQSDILAFTSDPDYQSPKWPEGYWVEQDYPSSEAEWKKSIEQILTDREAFLQILTDPQNNLLQVFPHGDGQNILAEALLIADHNSYHIGEIILMRRLLQNWP